ncbi:MAG: hypothetical protein VKK97_11010 [Synechococcaceae cyanobacterium]|jgi:hypothetical protein|nr:hypothetical protein [Synechococcaceae cyanobacterium]
MSRRRGLQVVGGSHKASAGATRTVVRQRRRPPRSRLILESVLLMAAGVGVLVLLLQLPELIDLDSLLLISTAIGHLIGGLSQLLLGVLQLLAVLLLVALALLALLLLVAGLVRFVRAVLAKAPPRSSSAPSRR